MATRVYLRVNTQISAEVSRPNKDDFSVQIIDISYGGFCINSKELLQEGDLIHLQFDLPGFFIPFKIPSLVVRNMSDELSLNRKYPYRFGLKIMEYSEAWNQKIPLWIKDNISSRGIRIKTSICFGATALGFLAKAALSNCSTLVFGQASQRFEYWGFLRLVTKVMMHPYFSTLMACLLVFCGWAVLNPNRNKRFFNTMTAILVASSMVMRVFLKHQLIWGGNSHHLVYAMDLVMTFCAGIGIILLIQAEKNFRYYDMHLKSEIIAPASLS